MSNYTKSTNFAVKDGLSAGTAAKRVRGTEIDDEYNAIAIAVATKANINNTALTGVPTAPTASASTNSTQLATTAYVKLNAPTAAQVNAHAYPVGSVYTSAVATNPATLLGVGVWEVFGSGRVMLGAGGGYTAGNTGGATTDSHALTIAQMPSHNHGVPTHNNGGPAQLNNYYGNAVTAPTNYNDLTNSTGGGAVHTHDIMQPYIVVYIWKRTS